MPRKSLSLAALFALVAVAAFPFAMPHAAAVPAAISPAQSKTAAIEQKLLGTWDTCRACGGEITFSPGGVYQRTNYSPGGNTVVGLWRIEWDELPPKLVLRSTASDDKDYIGQVTEVRIAKLTEDELVFEYAEGWTARHLRGSPRATEKRILERLQGAWVLTAVEQADGTPVPADKLAGFKPLVIAGEKWNNPQPAESAASMVLNAGSGKLELDTETSTSAVDFVCTSGPGGGKTQQAIFRLDGNVLKVCIGLKSRPANFQRNITVPYAEGRVVLTFKPKAD